MLIGNSKERVTTVFVVGLVPVAVTVTYCTPEGTGVKKVAVLPPHPLIPALIAAIANRSHKALLNLRLRRAQKASTPPSGRNAAVVPKLKLSGSDAGVETEIMAVTVVVLVAVNVRAGGVIEQLT